MKINRDVIACAALRLLNETGVDGITMRLLAKELDRQAATLYWHVKNKQELMDAMAEVLFREAVQGLEAPRREETWQDWLADWAHRMRASLLRYRDGGKVFAGSAISDQAIFRVTELGLRTLTDDGFPLRDASEGLSTILHYTVGYTIEEQARQGPNYSGDNPYHDGTVFQQLDPEQYPLITQARGHLFNPDADAAFSNGLRIILAGLDANRRR